MTSDADDLRPAAGVRDACIALHLQRAVRAVTRAYDTAFRPLRITSGQFSILVSLLQPEPPTVGRLAAQLAMDHATLTANLKPLERRGLVSAAIDKKDRRSRLLSLTGDGRDLIRRAIPLWEEAQAALRPAAPDLEHLRLQLRLLAFPDRTLD